MVVETFQIIYTRQDISDTLIQVWYGMGMRVANIKTWDVIRLSCGVGGLPVGVDGAIVSDDLAVGGPHVEDGLLCTDSCTSGVAAWTEPMVLGGSGGSGSKSSVGGTVDGLSQHSV